jgi:HD-GYP domain-containing protein (c-di-GMP phosphodiesterase class II)
VIGSHHERWDGKGYPRGQQGDEIPLAARVFAIADTFDTMTHEQPWRAALTEEHALEEIGRLSGAQLDPALTAIFLDELGPATEA